MASPYTVVTSSAMLRFSALLAVSILCITDSWASPIPELALDGKVPIGKGCTATIKSPS